MVRDLWSPMAGMSARRKIAIAATALPVLLASAVWGVLMPHSPTRVPMEAARTQLACGELLLTQTYTASVEPYWVWLYHRPSPTALWAQYFVDDEAPYWWGHLRNRPDDEAAALTLFGRVIGDFDCAGPTFHLRGRLRSVEQTISDPFDVSQAHRRPLP